jgi:hypothetical protein
MFIAEPHEAIQDVMEINFGFQIQSIAGQSVEQIKSQQQEEGKSSTAADKKETPPKEQASSEFSAMKQEEQMKEKILAGATRIYQQDEVNPLLT